MGFLAHAVNEYVHARHSAFRGVVPLGHVSLLPGRNSSERREICYFIVRCPAWRMKFAWLVYKHLCMLELGRGT